MAKGGERMSNLIAAEELIVEKNNNPKAVEKLREDLYNESRIPDSPYSWGALARVVLTVAGYEDFRGYDEGTDYFNEGYTNVMNGEFDI